MTLAQWAVSSTTGRWSKISSRNILPLSGTTTSGTTTPDLPARRNSSNSLPESEAVVAMTPGRWPRKWWTRSTLTSSSSPMEKSCLVMLKCVIKFWKGPTRKASTSVKQFVTPLVNGENPTFLSPVHLPAMEKAEFSAKVAITPWEQWCSTPMRTSRSFRSLLKSAYKISKQTSKRSNSSSLPRTWVETPTPRWRIS